MAKAEREFAVEAEAIRLMEFLSLHESVGRLLPFVENTDENGHWVIKDQQAKITQTKSIAPELTIRSGGVLEWVAKGGNLTSTIKFEIKQDGSRSRVKASLRMEVSGALGTVLAPIISLNVRNQLDALVDRLREEAKGSGCIVTDCQKCSQCGL
jgi:carbon monoxide dehydrogenase subunit G